MSRAADRLARVLRDAVASAGLTLTLGPLTSRPWHSALFCGESHVAEVAGADDAAVSAWLDALPELDLPIPGHVAEAAVDRITRRDGTLTASLALLTIEA
jgi:hypothetical protein